MSRSFRSILKWSVPFIASAFALSGCGSGSGGSADLGSGGSVNGPPPPVSYNESFDFKSTVDWFVVGTPPTHARFSGGQATDTGAGFWIIPKGKTGVIDFGTPADAVKFSTQDAFTATAAAGAPAQKTAAAGSGKVNPPFTAATYIRGLASDWTVRPDRQFVEVAENILEVTLPLTTAVQANGEYDAADEPGEFKVADAGWTTPNCGGGDSPRINIGAAYTLNCNSASGNLDLTIPTDGDYKFRLDTTGSTADAPKATLLITKVTGGGGGGGEEPPPADSTIIRIHSVTVVANATTPAGVESVKTIKGLGSLSVDELRQGGDARITRIEIENTGTNGDVGVASIAWTADARFALATQQVDIFYSRPAGSVTGTKIVVGGKTYDCVAPPAGSPYGCVAHNVDVTPYANATMTVQNADSSTESIVFNGGSGAEDVYAYSGNTYASTGTPAAAPAVANAAAHWVNAGTLLYDPPAGGTKVELLFSPDASITTGPAGFLGTYQTIALGVGTNPQPAFNKQLINMKAWSLPAAAVTNAKEIARGQLIAVARDANGKILAATRVQSAGALDDLYANAAFGAQLGVTYASGAPTLAVWAPTALATPGVTVNLYDDASDTTPEPYAMVLDASTGVWSVTGNASWNRKFYTISLKVFSYAANAIVTNEVTDPYSVSLATDSKRSQFVNLEDADLKPAGWDSMVQPALAAPEDSVIYELHVRDFSIGDSSVPAADRGKFTAFDIPGTAGRSHLQQLAQAGLTHVHILPAFDIATVKENSADQVNLDDPVEKLCAANSAAANLCVTDAGKTIRKAIEDAIAGGALDVPQRIAGWMRGLDGFNWGYDPYHFGVPEGSYATDPNGPERILEFRRMVKGLNDIGLRTIMDVVYNHTNESGQNAKSVLDKIVPGYYYRRDKTSGSVTTGSCCQDTAAEFRMMEKLMIDTGKMWVQEYKVSGFRFDLMGLHPIWAMTDFQDAVKAVNPSVYIYGEGWNCCGTEDDQRFTAARQAHLGGTGIGSFSDRIRDPVRGGGPFDSGVQYVKNQGFVSGWYYDPNSENTGSVDDRKALIADTDNIRVWLAGGLTDYQLQNSLGQTVTGAGVDYRGQASGYTKDPQEAINYIDKHDNQTLWDYSEYKNPTGTPIADRVRAQNVGQSLILLGQGVPFMQAGSDILRSKSGDRDSYDSGDWFNALDWTLSGSRWGQGLPIADKNSGEWSILQSKYQDVTTYPGPANLQRAFDHVREMLQIRKSSPLFRLRDAAQVNLRVKFLNTGPSQVPGVIAMEIDGCTEPNQPVPDKGAYMNIFNASDEPVTLPLFGSEVWTLHPVLVASTDPIVKTSKHDANGFYVPARTTAVFSRVSQKSCAPYPVDMFVRGSFNDWGNTAATLPNYKLEFQGGKDYRVSAPIGTAGPQQFKVADANWVAATNCGAAADGATAYLGQPFPMVCNNDSKNINLSAPSAGNYTFSLNAASTVNPVLTVTRTSPSKDLTVFVRGLFGDWGTTRPMAWDGVSLYSAGIASTGTSSAFKIATDDWSTLNCGGPEGGSDTVTVGQAYTLVCTGNSSNLNITLQNGANYVFAVDAANQAALKLTVEPKPVDVFVRGINGDWTDGAQNRMSYLGFGTYQIDRAVAAGATPFKIASSDWSTVNCGYPTTGQEVAVGTKFTMNCPANENLNLTAPAAGTYRFKYTAADNGLLITGP